MNTKRKTKADPPTMFPTLGEWERMPQQSKDAYLSQLKHPDWLSESELGKLAPSDRDAYYKSFRKCELTQFLLYLAEQQSRTQKGMEANIMADERMCNKVLEESFPLPPATSRFQMPDLISFRENWIKACEEQKRADMELYYESRSSSLSPQQEALLAATARTLKELNAQTGTKQRRERAPGMNDKTVASMFNAKAQPLVRKVIKNNGDEKGEYTAAVKESRDKGEKGGMIDTYGGYCIYEPKRGGDRSGYATYGTLSVTGLRNWLKKYPNAQKRHPYCGFHAGMLEDPAALSACADIWGRRCIEYARQFYEWRKTHRTAPRSQFRFNASQTVHGAEKMAATQ